MAETKPIPVRLSNEMIARLDQAAVKAHLSNRTEVIKLCISSFLEYFEAHDHAELPLNWEEMIACLDGRRRPVDPLPPPGKPRCEWTLEEEAAWQSVLGENTK
jgi:hypothetical protein